MTDLTDHIAETLYQLGIGNDTAEATATTILTTLQDPTP